ncbi:MAG: hypothetical protein ABII71_05015 [Candidatus Micrarchaeota archaeon]
MEKGKKDDFTLKAIVGTALALLLSVGIFLVANLLMPFRQLGPGPEFGDAMLQIFIAHTALSFFMLALSVFLLFTYMRDYLMLRSRFTLGLLLAIFSFMLFAVAANPLLHKFLGIYGSGGLFTLVPYFFASISLAILVWVSSK